MWGSDSFMFASLAEELGTGFGFQAAAASLTPFRVKTSKSELARTNLFEFPSWNRHGDAGKQQQRRRKLAPLEPGLLAFLDFSYRELAVDAVRDETDAVPRLDRFQHC